MEKERPLVLLMGPAEGSETLHSYHTFFSSTHRERCSTTSEFAGRYIGWRIGKKSGNHENMPSENVLGKMEMCTPP